MGRPRIHPHGKTNSDRVRESNERLRKAGGKILTVRLPKEAVERLEKLSRRWDLPNTLSEIILYFIMREPIRRSSTPLPPEKEKRKGGSH